MSFNVRIRGLIAITGMVINLWIRLVFPDSGLAASIGGTIWGIAATLAMVGVGGHLYRTDLWIRELESRAAATPPPPSPSSDESQP